MKRSARHWNWIPWLVCVAVAGLPSVAPAAGQDGEYTAVTAANPEVPLDELTLRLDPLTRAELEVEAQAWMALLQRKVQQISDAEIAVKHERHEMERAQEVAEAAEEAFTEALDAMPSDDRRRYTSIEYVATLGELEMLAEAPVPIGPGGDLLNGRIYFGSGSHLYSYQLPETGTE